MDKLVVFDLLRKKYIASIPLLYENISEFSLITEALAKESWAAKSLKEKQYKRESFLRKTKSPDSVINSKYYFSLVQSSSLIIKIIDKIGDDILFNNEDTGANIGQLRIYAIMIIAQNYIDEKILPIHHLHPKFIQNIAKDYDQQYPELKLNELSKVYTEMYELWPDRPDRDQEKPEK